MRKLLHYSLFAAFAVLLLSSCATQKTAFTYDVYKDSGWTEYDLRQMKFYLSDEIVIGRAVTKHKTKIKRGKVRKVNGQWIEEIKIPEGTVGTFVKMPRSSQLAIRFTDCDRCYLVFEKKSRKDDRFVLRTKGKRHKKGQLKFNGKTYFASANSQEAHLLIKMKEIDRRVKRKYELRGSTAVR